MRPQDIPPHLHDRYGIRAPSKWRWVVWAATGIVLIPLIGYAGLRYAASQNRPYALIQWGASGSAVSVTFHVTPSDRPLWCAIRAQDFEHFDVGYAVVGVRPGISSMTLDVNVLTPPVAVDVVDCDADPYSLPGPQFRPGAQGPAQQLPAIAPGVITDELLRKALQ